MTLLLVLLTQEPLDRPLDFPSQVGPAPQVVAALKQASGVDLRVAKTVENEIVGLACPGRPLKEAMEALALAVDAGWTAKAGGYELARSHEQELRLRARERAFNLALLKSAFDQAIETASALTPLTKAEAEDLFAAELADRNRTPNRPAVKVQGPLDRFAVRAMARLKPEDFIDHLGRGRVVASSDPTPMQTKLPADLEPLVRLLEQEQDVWSQVAAITRPQIRAIASEWARP